MDRHKLSLSTRIDLNFPCRSILILLDRKEALFLHITSENGNFTFPRMVRSYWKETMNFNNSTIKLDAEKLR